MLIWTWLVENILLSTSSSRGALYDCTDQLQLCWGFGSHLQYYLATLPTASRYSHAPAWGWRRWAQFISDFSNLHIFLLARPAASYRSPCALGSGWPMMWEVTVYKQIDFLLALWSVTAPLSPFSVFFFNNTSSFSSCHRNGLVSWVRECCVQCKDLRIVKTSRSQSSFFLFFFNNFWMTWKTGNGKFSHLCKHLISKVVRQQIN